MKKLLSSLLLLAMMFSSIYGVNGAAVTNWHEFASGGNVINTTTPNSIENTAVVWSKDFTSGWDNLSNLIIVNDELYFTTGTGSKLMKLDLNGNIIDELELASYMGYNADILYAEGMIFVPLGDSRVQAIDANTMTSLWISEEADVALQGRFTYYDGYLYFGSYDYAGEGSYYGLQVSDDNPNTPDETKSFAWTYTPTSGGYNWAKAVVYQNVLYFAGLDGKVVAHDLKNNAVIDTYQAEGGISCALTLVGNQLYFTTKAGNIYALTINSDHKFGQAISASLGNGASSSSTPTVYNGRVYVGGGLGYGNPGFISVLNAQTLETIYSVNTDNDVQASPLVTTAYGEKVVAYFTMNAYPGGLYALTDDLKTNTGSIEAIYTPSGDALNYCATSAIADSYGNLYHYNDSGYITKFTKANREDLTLINTNTNIQVEGNFFKGTTLNTTVANSGERVDNLLQQFETLNKLTVYDISLSLNNVSVQPLDEVKVTLDLPTNYNQERLKLYYLNDAMELEELPYVIENNKVVFTTNHFSSYILAEVKEDIKDETSGDNQTPPASTPNENEVMNKEVPPTGDKTSNTVYIVVGALAAVAIIVLVVLGKKKK